MLYGQQTYDLYVRNGSFPELKKECNSILEKDENYIREKCDSIKHGIGQELYHYMLPLMLADKDIYLFKDIFGLKCQDDFLRDMLWTVEG